MKAGRVSWKGCLTTPCHIYIWHIFLQRIRLHSTTPMFRRGITAEKKTELHKPQAMCRCQSSDKEMRSTKSRRESFGLSLIVPGRTTVKYGMQSVSWIGQYRDGKCKAVFFIISSAFPSSVLCSLTPKQHEIIPSPPPSILPCSSSSYHLILLRQRLWWFLIGILFFCLFSSDDERSLRRAPLTRRRWRGVKWTSGRVVGRKTKFWDKIT